MENKAKKTMNRRRPVGDSSVAVDLETDSAAGKSEVERRKAGARANGGFMAKFQYGDVPPTDLLAILSVYFVQGSMNLSRIALSVFLKDDLQLPPAQVSFIEASTFIPWMIKPLYGFLSDSVPLLGYKRKSYLQVCGLLNSLSWLFFAAFVDSPAAATVAIIGSAGESTPTSNFPSQSSQTPFSTSTPSFDRKGRTLS